MRVCLWAWLVGFGLGYGWPAGWMCWMTDDLGWLGFDVCEGQAGDSTRNGRPQWDLKDTLGSFAFGVHFNTNSCCFWLSSSRL